jgi:hypothetical protein
VGSSRFVLSRDPNPLSGAPIQSIDNPQWNILLPRLTEGTYYWSIRAFTPDGFDISPAQPASFRVLPVSIQTVALESPPTFPGLEARQGGGTIRWSSAEPVENSRFILSRSADLSGAPILSLDNPSRTVTLPRLTEGTYYWTIQAQTSDGFDITPRQPASFRVLPVPLLAPPREIQPEQNSRIDTGYLQRNRNITFSWTAVAGANGYIFTLYRAGSPEPLIRSAPVSQARYQLEDLSILENGDFLWQVEALNLSVDGTVEQHGERGEFRFTLSIPQPGAPVLQNPGILYGL